MLLLAVFIFTYKWDARMVKLLIFFTMFSDKNNKRLSRKNKDKMKIVHVLNESSTHFVGG